ncbi:MAG: DUF58 domain-containing protein [Microbacteriaceae bacterium]
MAKIRGDGSTRTTLTPRGRGFVVISIVLGLVGFGLGNEILLIAAFLLAVLVVIGRVLMARKVLRLEATRSFDPGLVASGRSTQVNVVMSNRSRSSSSSALWRDRLPWEPGFTEQHSMRPLVGHRDRYSNPGNAAKFRYELNPPYRGVFDIGPIHLVAGDPFGLAVGTVTLAGTDTLIVTPAVTDLSGRGLTLESGNGDSRVVERFVSGSDDDLMTREYRSGDALRRVHWRASARHGELMVRQEEQRSRPEVRLLFDTRSDGYRDVTDDRQTVGPESDSFEWVVSLVASLGVQLENSGFAVSTLESAGAPQTAASDAHRGSRSELALLENLAEVRLDHRQPSLDGAASRTDSERTSAPVFAVLCSPTPETRDWVVRQRRANERGTVVLLASGLPMMHELMDPDAPTTRAVFEGAGWHCIDAEIRDDATVIWAAVANAADVRG